MNITNNEIQKLENTKNEVEWNSVCDEIKRARGNKYPPDWWMKVMMSGLAEKARASWLRETIEVPRDPGIGNPNVTVDIEKYLYSVFAEDMEEAFSYKELTSMVKRKFRSQYGDDLAPHVAWAIDKLHFNNDIKRVAPGVFESANGPDEVYTERETGHAEPGQHAGRGYNTKGTPRIRSKKEFNAELRKALVSVRMGKNMGDSAEYLLSILTPERNWNQVAVKLAIKQIYGGIDAELEEMPHPPKNSSSPA